MSIQVVVIKVIFTIIHYDCCNNDYLNLYIYR